MLFRIYFLGLERVAEELMGRRKWKLYQEVLARSQLNVNAANLDQNSIPDQSSRLDYFHQQEKPRLASPTQHRPLAENHLKESEVVTIKSESSEKTDVKVCTVAEKGNLEERLAEDSLGNSEINITKSQDSSEVSPTPIDWTPTDKCYFCVGGKLLTVNERGELVAESGPASSEAELANRQASLDSDSDSSDSSPETEVQNQTGNNANKAVTSLLRDSLPPNMTSLESFAHLAAVASIRGIPPFYSNIWYQQLAQQVPPATPTTSDTNVAARSPSAKESPSPSDVTGEQPLDLSAKPSPNSSLSGGGDPKQVYRAKPRMSSISGRRTYTEDELNSALHDIISGKLGTRRAAVLYGIPRSTLRNKVYKIALEQKREASILNQPLEDLDADDEDKESGDEDKEDKLSASPMDSQVDDLTRYTTSHISPFQKITKICENNPVDIKPSISHEPAAKLSSTPTQSQTPPIPPQWFDPNLLLQSLLLTGGLGGLVQPKHEDATAEFIKNLMLQHQELIKEQIKNSSTTSDLINNGKSNISDPRILMQSLSAPQHSSQQQHAHTSHHYPNRLIKSETPEMSSTAEMSEMSDDPSVILKIPSYKPIAGSSSSGKNGESLGSPVPRATPPMLSRSPQQPNSLPGISPPLIRQSSDSQSPPIISGKNILSLKDVIANSLSRTFSQQAIKDTNQKLGCMTENSDQYKRSSISVIKNIGGTDLTKFGATPNLLSNNSGSSSASQNSSVVSGGVGGKGTRPKRGKYRNYDRDSLVEAVRAVQRGEMSVHRAGSYYGVPHSTLEYKVKERHLMRPRKREPKPQPLDDRAGNSSSSSTNSKNTHIPGIAAVSSIDKVKSSSAAQKPALKNNPPFPSTSPNGMKVPIFEQALAAQLQYSQHLFWPHSTGFAGIPLDFTRAQAGATSTAATSFPPSNENFLTTQIMQRFHEDNNRHNVNCNLNTTNSTTPTPTTSNNKPALSNSNTSGKTNRDSLYDATGSNGSLLDGIIRQTLDRKTNDIPHGVLRDQLVRNALLPSIGNSEQLAATKPKRPGSPLQFPAMDIKRERSSPSTPSLISDPDPNSVEPDISKEPVESLRKMQEGLSLKIDDNLHQQSLLHHHHQSLHPHHQLQQQQQSQHHLHLQQATANARHITIEDLNGSGSSLYEKLGQIKAETEDSL